MEFNFKKVGEFLKRRAKRLLIIILIPIVVIGGLLGAIVRHLKLKDTSYSANDETNAPYVAGEYMDGVSIDDDGTLNTELTAQELWDQMKKNKNRAVDYLSGPEDLKKLINAEMVTRYPDTRKASEIDNTPLNWNDGELSDINSKKAQGIIKLSRADTNGNNYTMEYTDPETFQSYIDKYNSSGSDSDKNTALKYFTLEKTTTVTGGLQAGTIKDGESVDIPDGLGDIHTFMGWQTITSPSSTQYKLRQTAGMNFDENGFGKINGRFVIACTTTYGEVGDYVDFYKDDGGVIPAIIGDIKNQKDAGCNEWGHENGHCVVEFIVNKNTWYNSGSDNPKGYGDPTKEYHTEWNNKKITKAVNGGSYFDKPDFTGDNITENGKKASSSDDNKNEEKKTTRYYAKVATWSDQTTTITSDDPDVSGSESKSQSMTSTNVNYQDMVKGIAMPFEYLWDYVVMGEDAKFSLELADLVLNSEIEIKVHDNLQEEIDTVTNKYTNKVKEQTNVTATMNYGNTSASENQQNFVKNFPEQEPDSEKHTYQVKSETITRTNTLNVAIIKANVWIEDYTQQFTQDQPTTISSSSNTENLEPKDYPNTPNETITNDRFGHGAEFVNEKTNELKLDYTYVNGTASVTSKVYYATVDRSVENSHQTIVTNYVSSPPDFKEKTDPDATEDNFVTLLRKHRRLKASIEEADDWLFSMIKQNQSTADMLDLTKYLLNKVFKREKYETKFKFDEFASNLATVGQTLSGGDESATASGSRIIEIAKSKLGCRYVLRSKRS